MTGKRATSTEDMRMREQDFDRIMRDALQVKPEGAKKPTKPKKAKAKPAPRKTKSAR